MFALHRSCRLADFRVSWKFATFESCLNSHYIQSIRALRKTFCRLPGFRLGCRLIQISTIHCQMDWLCRTYNECPKVIKMYVVILVFSSTPDPFFNLNFEQKFHNKGPLTLKGCLGTCLIFLFISTSMTNCLASCSIFVLPAPLLFLALKRYFVLFSRAFSPTFPSALAHPAAPPLHMS